MVTTLLALLHGCTPGTADSPVDDGSTVVDTEDTEDTEDTDPPEDPVPVSLLRIDAHVHPYGRNEDGSYGFDGGVALGSVVAANNLQVALGSVHDGSDQDNLDAMRAVAATYPEVLPLLWVVPTSEWSDAVAESALRDHGFGGIKLHPTRDEYPADDVRLDPVLELAARYDVPVVIHTAGDDPSLPSRVGTLAARHPEVDVVLYHAGLGTDHTGALAVAQGCANCLLEVSWVDVSASLHLISELGAERVLFGTDASIDGADHYENDWGSGVGDGSWDAWLVRAGRELPRAQWRQLMVEDAIRLFSLVTVHAHRPSATAVALELDLGDGPLAETWPMVDEGNGWWRRTVAAPRGLAFRVEADALTTGGPIAAEHPEVWERDGVLVDAPAPTVVQFTVDVGPSHAVFVRGSGYPLSWGAGEPAEWTSGNVWRLELHGVTGPLEVKALIDDATWETGDDHLVEPGTTASFTPVFPG